MQVRYDNQGDFSGTPAQSQAKFNTFTALQNGNGVPVVVSVTAKKTMKAPVCLGAIPRAGCAGTFVGLPLYTLRWCQPVRRAVRRCTFITNLTPTTKTIDGAPSTMPDHPQGVAASVQPSCGLSVAR